MEFSDGGFHFRLEKNNVTLNRQTIDKKMSHILESVPGV